MHRLPFQSCLARSCEQSNNFILRTPAVASGKPKQFSERSAPGVIQLGCRSDPGEWLDCLLPRFIQLRARYLPLTGQNLPDSNSCLKSAERVATHGMGTVVQRISCFEE